MQESNAFDQFFSTISTFQTKDFSNSTNTELLLLKEMIDHALSTRPAASLHWTDQRGEDKQPTMNAIHSKKLADAPVVQVGLLSSNVPVMVDPSTHSPPVSFHSLGYLVPHSEPVEDSKKRKRVKSSRELPKAKQPRTRETPSPPRYTDSEEEDDASLSGASSQANTLKNKNLYVTAAGLQMMRGENRLKIDFIDFGTPGDVPQRFGRNHCTIPDGLCGANHVYDQPWRFEISHAPLQDCDPLNELKVGIKWKITNLISGSAVEVIETAQDAAKREMTGRTICNLVLRKAFEMRASELETSLSKLENDPSAFSQTQNLIKSLRPKRLTVGLLFFGLLHECVQKRLEMMMMQTCNKAL